MSDNPLKDPIFKSLGDISQHTATVNNNLQGKILPAIVESYNGFTAVVSIEVSSINNYPKLEVPVLRSEYIRLPIQKGCRGFLIPLAVNIDHIIGMGQTAPTDSPGFNLADTAFLPVSSKEDQKVDEDTLVIYGEGKGVKIQSKDGKISVHVTKDSIELKGDTTIDKNLTVTGDVTIKGSLTVNGIEFKGHTHLNGNQGEPTGGVIKK